jgi:hypothetical protein
VHGNVRQDQAFPEQLGFLDRRAPAFEQGRIEHPGRIPHQRQHLCPGHETQHAEAVAEGMLLHRGHEVRDMRAAAEIARVAGAYDLDRFRHALQGLDHDGVILVPPELVRKQQVAFAQAVLARNVAKSMGASAASTSGVNGSTCARTAASSG